MCDAAERNEAMQLLGKLEDILAQLDELSLVQSAARIASAIDGLKAEIGAPPADFLTTDQSAELVRAAERS